MTVDEAPTEPPQSPLARIRAARGSLHVRESAITIVAGLLTYSLGIVTGPLLARDLGPAGRGDLAAVLVPGQLFGYLVLLGVGLAAAYYSADHTDGELVATGTVTTWLVGVPAVAILWPIIPRFLEGHDPLTITALRCFLVADVVAVPPLILLELLRAKTAGRTYNILRSLAVILNAAAVALLFVLSHLHLRAALVSAVASIIVANAYVLVRCRPATRLRVSFRLGVKMLRYGSGVLLSSVAGQIVSRFDQVLLVGFVAPAQLGIYAVSVNAASASVPVGQGAAMALLPQRRRGSSAGLARRTALSVALVSSTICIGVAIAAPIILPLVYGKEFRAGVHALWIILPGQVLADVANVLNGDLVARGHTGRSSLGVIGAAIVTLATLPFLVRRFGIEGAALATTISYVAYLLVTVVVVMRARDGGSHPPTDVDVLRLEDEERALGGQGETGMG